MASPSIGELGWKIYALSTQLQKIQSHPHSERRQPVGETEVRDLLRMRCQQLMELL